jgi:beta-glucuronidase
VTVKTEIEGENGRVGVSLAIRDWRLGVSARLAVGGVEMDVELAEETAVAHLSISDAKFWSPDSPYLYDLVVELLADGQMIDRYTLPIGIRTIEVDGDALLLNGKPIVLRGFGRHEDFPVAGRGTVPAVNIKDFALMNWIGANSFRTSHYPYDEEMLALADRLGFLVISETPAVGLFFQEDGLDRRLQLCRQMTQELIARDKNHPSVIMWSLANEPRSVHGNEVPFFRNLYTLAKSLDDTRPITIVSDLFTEEASFTFFDVVCLNVYRGWYQESGELAAGLAQFERILDEAFAKFGKPILVTEFGADAMPGHHALPPEMFSEEYQADFIASYIAVMDEKPFVAGQHVWNLCDFKTAQGVKRPFAMNFKGVFTRDRRPKLAAHRLKEIWRLETGD